MYIDFWKILKFEQLLLNLPVRFRHMNIYIFLQLTTKLTLHVSSMSNHDDLN